MPVSPYFTLIPIALGLFWLLFWSRRKYQQRKRLQTQQEAERVKLAAAEKTSLPTDAVEMWTNGTRPQLPGRSGKVMLILVGTFAGNVGVKLLTLLDLSGLDHIIGSILLVELNERQRAKFLEELPPVFLDRLVIADVPALPGGILNRDPGWARLNIDRWGSHLRNRAEEVCDRHLRLNNLQDPVQVLTFVSEGGSASLGTEPLKVIKSRFGLAQYIGFTAYPVDDRLRARVKPVLNEYAAAGITGFVVSDNLGDQQHIERDALKNDLGMLALLLGLASAANTADAAVEPDNALTLLFPDEAGQLVSYRTVVSSLPGYKFQPHPKLPARYFVRRDSLASLILTNLTEVEKDEHAAVSAQFGHPGTSRFDLVLTALEPLSLKAVEDEVVSSRRLKAPDRRNYHLLFAGMKSVIDPTKPTCPVITVSVQALQDSVSHLEQLSAPKLAGPSAWPKLGMGQADLSVSQHRIQEETDARSTEDSNDFPFPGS